MREYIIPKEPRKAPEAAGGSPVVVLPDAEPPARRLRTRLRERDFIIRYEGRYLGHFRAHRPVLPRIAFGQVARELRSRIADFNPERLILYRPVKLHVKSFAGAEVAAAGGAFDWFNPTQSE